VDKDDTPSPEKFVKSLRWPEKLMISIPLAFSLLEITLLVLLCHITDKSTAGGGMTSNRLENKTNVKRLNGRLI